MKKVMLIAATALAIHTSAYARTWTSAEGGKTFEAEFNSLTGDTVTVIKNGRIRKFPLSIISQADQDWIQTEIEKQKNEEIENDKDSAPEAEEGEFQKQVGKKLVKLKGSRYSRTTLETTPEFFVLYYTASW